jgi:hypothetical protein
VFFIKHLFTKARVATADKKYDNYACRCHKTYERVADKGYKSVDMFQNWETPITSMEAKKQLNGMYMRHIYNRSGTSLLLPLCTIFEIH